VPDTDELLAAYDAQLRTHYSEPLPAGVELELDPPLQRWFWAAGRGYVLYRDLDGVDGAELDELIARQVRAFADRSQSFEWKLHGHDRPDDLTARLRSAGLVPEDMETVVIADVADIADPPQLPDGVSLREVTTRAEFERIGAMESRVWGERNDGWLPTMLETEREADPEALTVLVAEAGGQVVCAGWVRFARGTDFATLWGGATLPEWRGRGIYRATVTHRANLARDRGYRFLEVDASSESRPILERLGFTPVTTTTPYVWSPPARATG
jgi:GNAT superfamily N-acetyltransferase